MGQLGSAVLVGIGALAAGCALVVLFGCRQMRLTQPLLNVDPIVGNRRFIVACALVVVAMMTSFSMSVLLPLYFEQAFGLEAITAGGLVLPAIAVNALTAIAGGRIMDARGSWPLLPVGFLLVMAGQAGIALASPLLELIPVVAASVVVYAGVGLVMAPSQTAGLKTLEPSLHPDGVSILNTLVMVAASFGPSLFVGIMATGEADAAAIGVSAGQAAASGFSSAVAVAAGIALVGFALALAFAWRERSSARRTARMDDSSMKGLQSC